MASEITRRITTNLKSHMVSLAAKHAKVRLKVNYGTQGSFWRVGSLMRGKRKTFLLTTPVSLCTVNPDDVEQIIYSIRKGA